MLQEVRTLLADSNEDVYLGRRGGGSEAADALETALRPAVEPTPETTLW
jgi:hypothetical protein